MLLAHFVGVCVEPVRLKLVWLNGNERFSYNDQHNQKQKLLCG
jgi:hypothetical protein